MFTNKPRKKLSSKTAAQTRRSTPADLLNRLTATELAAVLRILLEKHPTLKRDANAIAVEVVSEQSVENIADDVLDNVTVLDLDDLNERAGKHTWGYVEPGEAAEELLEEAVGGHLEDMRRLMDLDLKAASEAVCQGIVVGLFRCSREASGGMLDWAPDFPEYHASYVIEEYLRQFPAATRRDASVHLAAALGGLVPEWSEMTSRVAARAASSS